MDSNAKSSQLSFHSIIPFLTAANLLAYPLGWLIAYLRDSSFQRGISLALITLGRSSVCLLSVIAMTHLFLIVDHLDNDLMTLGYNQFAVLS